MPEQQFHFGSFLKLLVFALAFGILAFFLNVMFGISAQTIQMAIVLLLAVFAVVGFLKIRALRPRPMTAQQRKQRELLVVQERQLELCWKMNGTKVAQSRETTFYRRASSLAAGRSASDLQR